MNWNTRVRQVHRWLGVIFTLTVIANIVVMAVGQGRMPPPWVTYAPLPPLVFLMLTGQYLFVLPYAARWRSREHSVEQEL